MRSNHSIKQILKHVIRYASQQTKSAQFVANCPPYMQLSDKFSRTDPKYATELINSMTVHNDFLGENEERSLLDEILPYMRTLRYEFNHWDNAIHAYRETERVKWNDANKIILERVKELAFPIKSTTLKYIHILDLQKEGFIRPHVDAVRYCGDTIAGLSLMSNCVMRLVHVKDKEMFCDVLLKRRSLYIMKGPARYDYTHEVLKEKESLFNGQKVERDRRISVICRNEPKETDITQ